MKEQLLGKLSETLRSRLKQDNPDHVKLAQILNEQARFKILGEFQPSGNSSGKTFVQIHPIEGNLKGVVLSVCKDHVVMPVAG